MNNMIKNNILQRLTSVFGLMALLTCTLLATSAIAGSQSPQKNANRLVGLFESQVTATNCQGVVIKTFEAYEMFHLGGTLTSTDNQLFGGSGPGFGTWRYNGGGSYSAPFQIFTFNTTDGTNSGEAKITRDIQLAPDGNSYTSEGIAQILDVNGNLLFSFCVSEIATRVVD